MSVRQSRQAKNHRGQDIWSHLDRLVRPTKRYKHDRDGADGLLGMVGLGSSRRSLLVPSPPANQTPRPMARGP